MALGILETLMGIGWILIAIFGIVVLIGLIIWFIKMLFSKPIQSIQRDAIRDLKHDAAIQNQMGLKNLMLSGDKAHPPVYFGKIMGVIPKVPYIRTKTENGIKTVLDKLFEDIVLVRVKDNALFGWIPVIGDMVREELIIRLQPDEHSPFVMNGDITVYAVGIKRLGNSGYYITTNRNIPELLTVVFDQSHEYAIKQNVDALGIMANKVVEANAQHIKEMEKSGGVIKLVTGRVANSEQTK
jgi:hypothetical protein